MQVNLEIQTSGTAEALTVAEYGLLRDAARRIEHGRLVLAGLSPAQAETVLGIQEDLAAFVALVREDSP